MIMIYKYNFINIYINSNDYLIQPDELSQEEKENAKGRHFCIYFNQKNGNYIIKDLGIGFGAYLKLNSDYILKENTMIMIGNSFILVKFSKSENNLILNIYNRNSQNSQM